MNPHCVSDAALGVGPAVVGVFLSMALSMSPAAHATDEFTWPPVPPYAEPNSSLVLSPPGLSTVSPPDYFDQPGYSGFTENIHYAPAGDFTGTYDTTFKDQVYGSFPFYRDDTETVTDSSGAAPPVGTTWESTTFGFNYNIGSLPWSWIPYLNYSTTSPTGTADISVFQPFGHDLAFENQYFSGAEGTFDYVVFGNGDPIPVIDIPAAASSSAAADLFSADLPAPF